MPELPEVHTTVTGINARLKRLTIVDVWSDYASPRYANKEQIKNASYFKKFRTEIIGARFIRAERRGKNILIHLSGNRTILIHMKMTGHLLYGEYAYEKSNRTWLAKNPGPLQDPFNRHIRLVFSLSNGKHLAFSDLRKFAKVFVAPTDHIEHLPDLAHLGPEPLEEKFDFAAFKTQLAHAPRKPIKQVLMDQTIIAGIGNIYSDEMLWSAGIHPLSHPTAVPEKVLRVLFKSMKQVLTRGIDFGGDSDSDYRNIDGVPGTFQGKHNVYRKTNTSCIRRDCSGTIMRLRIGGRSAHFCNSHQTLFKS